MKAIETTGKIDKTGLLKLDKPLETKNQKVKVIILLPEKTDENEEQIWLHAISTNPSFDFLKAKEEDIYSLSDGIAFND